MVANHPNSYGGYSVEELGTVAIIATIVAVMTWFTAGQTGISRVATSGISAVVASVSVMVGLWVRGRW